MRIQYNFCSTIDILLHVINDMLNVDKLVSQCVKEFVNAKQTVSFEGGERVQASNSPSMAGFLLRGCRQSPCLMGSDGAKWGRVATPTTYNNYTVHNKVFKK